MVPHALLIQISTLPSSGLSPPINLNAPSLQLPAGVVGSEHGRKQGSYVHTVLTQKNVNLMDYLYIKSQKAHNI